MQRSQRQERIWTVEWPTAALLAACYAAWALAGLVLWPIAPILALVVLTIAIALQSSLMHEVAHGHPTRSGPVNELLVALPVGLVYPYRRFRALHLRHHADERLTDPFDDPESYYRALWQHRALPVWLRGLLWANNTMVGRFFLGPALATAGFFATEAKLLAGGDRAVARAWLHHAVGLAVLFPIVGRGFEMGFLAYLVPVYFGHSLIAIRTYAEHQWSERPDGRTVIVERSPLALLFLNNNLHLVHHKMPTAPWYRLPDLFRERRDEWLRMNGNYVYPGYLALFREFALKPKEQVVHPVLRREPEHGRAYQPRVRARSVSGIGQMPVPAKPPKD